MVTRRSNVVGDAFSSRLTGTVGAAVEAVLRLRAMADDPTPTMTTNRCQLLNGAFEAIEDVPAATGNDLEGEVVVVAADFTDRHKTSLVRAGSVAAPPTTLRSWAGGRQRPRPGWTWWHPVIGDTSAAHWGNNVVVSVEWMYPPEDEEPPVADSYTESEILAMFRPFRVVETVRDQYRGVADHPLGVEGETLHLGLPAGVHCHSAGARRTVGFQVLRHCCEAGRRRRTPAAGGLIDLVLHDTARAPESRAIENAACLALEASRSTRVHTLDLVIAGRELRRAIERR